MKTAKFVHNDTVKVTGTGQIGTVNEVRQIANGNLYSVKLSEDECSHIYVPEAELELVKIANDDETGLRVRYIT
jgi:hypothetical protein